MKKFVSMLLALVMILSLAACGKDKEPEVSDNSSIGSGEISDGILVGLDKIVDDADIGGDTSEPAESTGDQSENGSDVLGGSSEDEDPSETGDGSDILGDGSDIQGDGSEETDLAGDSSEGDEEGEETEEPNKFLIDTEAGETLMSAGIGEGGVAEVAAIREQLHVSAAEVSDEMLTHAVQFLNNYSKEGFIRTLETTSPVDDNTRYAAVIVCRLAGIPMETLWENEYVKESSVEVVVEILDNAEKNFKENGGTKK